jgi:hypothetical protein
MVIGIQTPLKSGEFPTPSKKKSLEFCQRFAYDASLIVDELTPAFNEKGVPYGYPG